MQEIDKIKFSTDLTYNINIMKDIFKNDNTFVFRYVESPDKTLKCAVFFFDGMVNSVAINESIIRPITLYNGETCRDSSFFAKSIVQINDSKTEPDVQKMLSSFLYGDSVIFVDGDSVPAIVNTKGFAIRSSSEPENEKVIQGSREGFTEGFMGNLAMVRRRLRTPYLKFSFITVGSESKTTAVLCYIDNLCDKRILAEVKKRLKHFNIDSALDSNYIAEFIKDSPFSPFATIGITERPDIMSAKLLEGRVGLIVDGTPVALTMPYIFQESFQANDDYYANFLYTNINRLLRIFGFFLTISIPALYVALLTYHQEMIPTKLLFSIASARAGVPFPTILEAIILLIVFEILKESGTRTPGTIGQTLSIVGGLVLGQAAVEARFVSAPIVIIIAFSGITALMVPKLKTASILCRLFLLILSSILGIYGYIFGLSMILIHLCNLTSFKTAYLTNILSVDTSSKRDVFIRFPWFSMIKNHRFIANKERQVK